MKPETLKAFNEELTELLEKYQVTLAIEDVPATQKVVVKLKEQPTQKDNPIV